jgi:hypothetical protein
VQGTLLDSTPSANGLRTLVDVQMVGDSRHFDGGGFVGRTLGLSEGALLPAVPDRRGVPRR